MHAQSAGEPERSDLRLLGAFMHAQSAGEPKRSDLRLLGAFMHALKRRRTASGAIQYESISNIKSSSKMIPNWKSTYRCFYSYIP